MRKTLREMQAQRKAEGHKTPGIDRPHIYLLPHCREPGKEWWGGYWNRRHPETGQFWSFQSITAPSREKVIETAKEWWETQKEPPSKKVLDYGMRHPYCL